LGLSNALRRIHALPPERGWVPLERDQPQQLRKTSLLEYA
jgi:hypothetical protein